MRVRVRNKGTVYGYGYGNNFFIGTGTVKSTGFFKFLMTEYGWIFFFQVRKINGLKSFEILVRVREWVRKFF